MLQSICGSYQLAHQVCFWSLTHFHPVGPAKQGFDILIKAILFTPESNSFDFAFCLSSTDQGASLDTALRSVTSSSLERSPPHTHTHPFGMDVFYFRWIDICRNNPQTTEMLAWFTWFSPYSQQRETQEFQVCDHWWLEEKNENHAHPYLGPWSQVKKTNFNQFYNRFCPQIRDLFGHRQQGKRNRSVMACVARWIGVRNDLKKEILLRYPLND